MSRVIQGWGEEYWELEKRLQRRLGVWKLSEHEHAGDAIQSFIKNATKDEVNAVIDETLGVAVDAKLSDTALQSLRNRLNEVRTQAENIGVRRTAEDSRERWFDTAQVCLNGHIINRQAESNPEANSKFCKQCGADPEPPEQDLLNPLNILHPLHCSKETSPQIFR